MVSKAALKSTNSKGFTESTLKTGLIKLNWNLKKDKESQWEDELGKQ